jgi:uncharacterized protein with ATP-grasp and redox domains
MSEPLTPTRKTDEGGRPFPWHCPRCRHKEVRRHVIPYQCERAHQGQIVTVVVNDLAVPKCDNCGELVFDYVAEEQINQVLHAQFVAMNDENPPVDSPVHAAHQ